MAATEGLAVRKDDLLVELDSAEINAEKAKAEAALLSSDANIKLCEISLGKANSDLKRSRSLYKSGAISLAQYEQAEKDFSNMTIQKQMADIQVQSSKAQLELIEAQTQFRRIYSPDDGVIAKKWVSEGDVVQPGQVLYSIYNLKKVTVLANMEETSIRKVRIGQAAEVAIDAYPGRKYSGKVISIFPCTASQMVPMQTINATGDFTKLTQYVSLRVSLDETPSNDISSRFPVLPGMSVEVWVKGD
jgi:membrane fusion protein (multidrug efflux system)